MIWDEGPRVTGSFSLGQELRKTLKEILPVPVVYEDLSTVYPPDHDVVQNTGGVESALSRHASI